MSSGLEHDVVRTGLVDIDCTVAPVGYLATSSLNGHGVLVVINSERSREPRNVRLLWAYLCSIVYSADAGQLV